MQHPVYPVHLATKRSSGPKPSKPSSGVLLDQHAPGQSPGLAEGRAYVTPQDVKTVGPDVLRHRLLVSYEAEAQDLTSDDIIAEVFNTVDVP